MKTGNATIVEAIKFLGTGTVDYIERLELGLRSALNLEISADRIEVSEDLKVFFGTNGRKEAFLVMAEEVIGINVVFKGLVPADVTTIASAIAYEKKRAK